MLPRGLVFQPGYSTVCPLCYPTPPPDSLFTGPELFSPRARFLPVVASCFAPGGDGISPARDKIARDKIAALARGPRRVARAVDCPRAFAGRSERAAPHQRRVR